MIGHQHEGQVGPCGLARQPQRQWLEVGGADRLFGHQDEGDVVVENLDEFRKIVAGSAANAGQLDQRLRHRGIAPARRENQRAKRTVSGEALVTRRAPAGAASRSPGSRGTPRNTPWKSTSGSPIRTPRRSRIRGSCPRAPRPLLDDGNGAADRARSLEVAQQDHRVGEIGDVDRRLHVAHQPVLGDGQEGRNTLAIEELQQFVHVQDQRILLRHRRLISVQAVDHHRLDVGDPGRRCAPCRRIHPATIRRHRAG